MEKKLTDQERAELDSIIDEHIELSNKEREHPSKRVDLLLNSICGGGIFLIFHFIKEVKVENLESNEIYFLIGSGVGFMLSILLNYFALELSLYQINEEEYLLTKMRDIATEQGEGWKEKTNKLGKKGADKVDSIHCTKNGMFKSAKFIMALSVIVLAIFLIKYLLN